MTMSSPSVFGSGVRSFGRPLSFAARDFADFADFEDPDFAVLREPAADFALREATGLSGLSPGSDLSAGSAAGFFADSA